MGHLDESKQLLTDESLDALTTSKPLPLATVMKLFPESESDEIVELIRECLTAAEAGDLSGIACVTIHRDGTARFLVIGSAYDNRAVTLELLERLRRKISDSLISG